MRTNLSLMAMLLVAAAMPTLAHHSFEAEYDGKKPVTLDGAVSKVDWMNPHIWVHIDVKDEKGNTAHWSCEGGNPNSLRRNGWQRDTLKTGDQVSIDGFRAKDGTNTCNMRSVKLADGKKVFAASSGDGGPQE
ncbi:MAG: hypothetical protein JWO19_3899 [Bryobacterales bacterium]|nr:hypothetical protein [Bryobacterales bacterium]